MITVTGATGLLGSRLLFDLLSSGYTVRALKRRSSNTEYIRHVFSFYTDDHDKLFNKVEWVDFDILDIDSVIDVLDGTSKLYHAAAFVSFNPADRKKMLRNNIQGTANIVNACLELKVEKLCHVSSTSALGPVTQGGMVTEDVMWVPEKRHTAYSESKFRSEMEVWRGIEEGLQAVIVNPSIIFGPGFWEKGSSSMFTVINKGLRYYPGGVTGFVSVKDVSECMIRLMNRPVSGERFIISAQNMAYREVFGMIARSLHVSPPDTEVTPFLAGIAWRLDALRSFFTGKRIITSEAVRAGSKKTYFSNEKIKKELGIEFQNMGDVINEIGKVFRGIQIMLLISFFFTQKTLEYLLQ